MIQQFPFKLILLTLIALGTTFFFLPPWGGPDVALQPILGDLNTNDIESISITIGDEEDKSTVKLFKSGPQEWSVDDMEGDIYLAHQPLIESLISLLEKDWTEIPSPPDSSSPKGKKILEDMELSPSKLIITLSTSAGNDSALILGSKLDGQDFCYISNEDYSSVGMAPIELQTFAIQPALYWRKRQIIELDEDAYDSIEITSLYGRVVLEKDSQKSQWSLSIPIKEDADTRSIEQKLEYLSSINAIEFRQNSDTFETSFSLRLGFLKDGKGYKSYEWRLIKRPEDDPAEEGEPPIFLLTELGSGARAIVTGEAIPMWSIAADDLRERQLLSFSPDNVSKVLVNISKTSPFQFVKDSESGEWHIELQPKKIKIPAQAGKIESFIRHASMMKIYKFPEFSWDQAKSINLAPPIASYTFLNSRSNENTTTPLAKLNLGRLNQEEQFIYASRMDEKNIYALQSVDGLSMPQNFHQFRIGKLFPSIEPEIKISELHWTSPNGDIKFKRENYSIKWHGLKDLESTVLNEFCKKIRAFSFDDWRGFGDSALESYRISKANESGKRLKIKFSNGTEKLLHYGRTSPRRGIYTSIDFEEGSYVFDFSKDLIDAISAIDEIRLYFEAK